jgi:ABC-2 type transport system ATP-binding protein
MAPIVEARALTKRFGKVEALRGLDLEVDSGQVVALLGKNGAGKTTFVRTVATLLRPDEGTLRVGGYDVVSKSAHVRRLIGLAGQYAAVEGAMTGRENLEMIARLYGQSRRQAKANATTTLTRLGLAEDGSRLVRTYSGGMRRKLDLGASLVGAPRLLLLDEPTTGLDPGSRVELWDAIRELVGNGTDVLLTTQYLDEADQLASRIVIIDNGRVIADGSPASLKSMAGRDVVEVQLHDGADLAPVATALRSIGPDEPVLDLATRRVSVSVAGGTEPLMAAARALDECGLVVDNLALRRPTLDEVFLTLTGRGVAA